MQAPSVPGPSTTAHRFFATTAKGMEALLVDEIRSLGGQDVVGVRAGVDFTGPLEVAYRACLWSRVANRVLLPLKKVPAENPEKLYGGVKSIRWSDHLGPSQTIAVDFAIGATKANAQGGRPAVSAPIRPRPGATVIKPRTDALRRPTPTVATPGITHSHFGALKVKDAIVDQLRSIHGERPSVDVARPDLRINVYVQNDEATVSLDLSGDSLHRRGYREDAAEAPLKENLAAAILLSAGWPAASRGEDPAPFLDPMCGSGTLPIEAAAIAGDVAPGLHREYYGFLGWRGHDAALWARLQAEARDRAREGLARKPFPRIIGYDEDFRVVRTALANVEQAGLRGLVHIEKREWAQAEPPALRAGVLVVNPPYGERLGETDELRPLYGSLGDRFKKHFPGWEAYVFTSNPELAKEVGLKPDRRIVLYNGALECRLLKYSLYAGSRRG